MVKVNFFGCIPAGRRNKLLPDTLTEYWLRHLGWIIDQCSRKTGRITRDLFGFGDQYAFGFSQHLIVQSTSYSNIASRRKKVIENAIAFDWKKFSICNRIFIIGWKGLHTPEPFPMVEEILYDKGTMFSIRLRDFDRCKPALFKWDPKGHFTVPSPAREEIMLEKSAS